MASELELREERSEGPGYIDCVEIYLPKKVEYLSKLYTFLHEAVTKRQSLLEVESSSQLVLDGFSIYEVDGAFWGENGVLWDERSLVIRILFPRPAETPSEQLRTRVRELGREIIAIAGNEQEVWICEYVQRVNKFRPNRIVV